MFTAVTDFALFPVSVTRQEVSSNLHCYIVRLNKTTPVHPVDPAEIGGVLRSTSLYVVIVISPDKGSDPSMSFSAISALGPGKPRRPWQRCHRHGKD